MKLTESTLRDMVKEILKEDEMPFPPPPDEESVKSAEQSLEKDEDIIQFFENDDAVEEGCSDEEVVLGEDGEDESLSLESIVQEEISRYIKKKNLNISQNSLNEGLAYDVAAAAGHFILDVIGLVPGVGAPADALNALWYAKEGRHSLAALSLLSMVPGAGQAATGGKYASKAAKLGKYIPKMFKAKKAVKPATGVGKTALKSKDYTIKAARELQEIMGLKTFKGSLFWKTISSILDEKDNPFGKDSKEIKRVMEKAGGDPADPETQKVVGDLVGHIQHPTPMRARGVQGITTASKETIEEFAPWLLSPADAASAGDPDAAIMSKNMAKANARLGRDRMPPERQLPEPEVLEPERQLQEPEVLEPEVIDQEVGPERQLPAPKEEGGLDVGDIIDIIGDMVDGDGSDPSQRNDIARSLGSKLLGLNP